MKLFGGNFLILVIISFSFLTTVSGVLLSGMMLNYIVGSYLTRGLISSLFSNSFKTILSTSAIPSRDISTTTISQSPSPNSMDAMHAIGQVVQTLGIGNYIKEMFSEDECKSSSCRSKEKKSKRKRKRKEDSEEDDISSAPIFHDSEDYSKYLIRGNREDPGEVANDLLTEDDPTNFYYIMKDQHKKITNKKKMRRTSHHISSSGGPALSGLFPPRSSPPAFYRGRLPIFRRFRKRAPIHVRFHSRS